MALKKDVGSLDMLASVPTKNWWAPYWKGQSGMPQARALVASVRGAEQLPAVVKVAIDSDLDDVSVQVIEVKTDWHAKRFVLAEVYDKGEQLIFRERFNAHTFPPPTPTTAPFRFSCDCRRRSSTLGS